MLNKTCTKCGETKAVSEFGKNKNRKDGLQAWCKACRRAYDQTEAGKQSHRRRVKKYHQTEKGKETLRRAVKKYYQTEAGKASQRRRNKKYDQSEKGKATKRRWRQKDGNRMVNNLRTRFWQALTGHTKNSSVLDLIGCSVDELWNHLESQFTEGMTRENYGEWHVDHIVPIKWFVDGWNDPAHPDCWHYTNLQPLWASDNCSKGARE